jgi:hypothetical protein
MSAPFVLAICGAAYIAIALYTFHILLAKSRGVDAFVSSAGKMANSNYNFFVIDSDNDGKTPTPNIPTTTTTPSGTPPRRPSNNNKVLPTTVPVTVPGGKLSYATTRATRRLRRARHGGPAIVQVPTGGYNCAVM